MIFTEEKWLRKTFGAEYDAYCKRVNRCIPWIPERSVVEKEGKSGMKELYETKISDAKWIACDIPANVGWIAYTACLVIAFVHYGEYPVLNIVGLVPAALILLGIAELVSERIEKLDRVLPRARLLRGFGALTLGCGSGVIVSLVAVILNFNAVYLIMLIGSAMCFLFAALLFSGYKKKEK